MAKPKVTKITHKSGERVAPPPDFSWIALPEQDRRTHRTEADALALREESHRVVVRDEPSLAAANALVVRIAEMKKSISAQKDLFLRPVKQKLVKPMEEFFRMLEKPLVEEDARLRRSIADYRMRRKEEERELQELLRDAERESGGIPLPVIPTLIPSVTDLEGGRITYAEKWKHEVVDVDQIPVEILRAAVRTKRGGEGLDQTLRGMVDGGVRAIPGVHIFPTEQLAVTGQ
jgi:hypothetical protein